MLVREKFQVLEAHVNLDTDDDCLTMSANKMQTSIVHYQIKKFFFFSSLDF